MDEKLYFEIFNKITDMIEELKNLQIQMEENYIENMQKQKGASSSFLFFIIF